MDRTRQIGQILNYIFGNGAPAPYMGLDLRGQVGDWVQRKQAQYFPNKYNNMLYYIPDEYDTGANGLANLIYNNR